jgi:hypothetical protein
MLFSYLDYSDFHVPYLWKCSLAIPFYHGTPHQLKFLVRITKVATTGRAEMHPHTYLPGG